MQQPMPAKLTKHLAQVDRRNVLVFGDFLETTQSGIVLFSQIGQRSDPITCSLRENHPGLRFPTRDFQQFSKAYFFVRYDHRFGLFDTIISSDHCCD
jgi:hypothetical protein